MQYKPPNIEILNNEEWRDVVGYESQYAISNYGRIYTKPRFDTLRGKGRWRNGKLLKPSLNRNSGYMSVVLYKNGPKTKLIHRLVAEAFIPNPLNKPEVNHIDCNKINNNVLNLEWATISENTQHAYDNGLINIIHDNSFLCKPIYQIDKKTNKIINEFSSIKEAMFELNFKTGSHIGQCANNTRKTAYGYIWRWKNNAV